MFWLEQSDKKMEIKDIQILKQAIKLSLLLNNIILYIENSREYIMKNY
jgi:hypothetical protein